MVSVCRKSKTGKIMSNFWILFISFYFYNFVSESWFPSKKSKQALSTCFLPNIKILRSRKVVYTKTHQSLYYAQVFFFQHGLVVQWSRILFKNASALKFIHSHEETSYMIVMSNPKSVVVLLRPYQSFFFRLFGVAI